MANSRYGAIRGRGRRVSRLDQWPLVPMLLVAFGIGGVAAVGLRDTGFAARLLDGPQAVSTAPVYSRSFPVCAGSVRVTCVVDGDTFWLDGVKYRIADINTPEVSQPSCAAEASLGRRATSRLAELLGSDPFSLARIDRDEDQYGRKLRVVERDGRSIGPILVAEGLAHEWRGRRESWC